MTTHRLDIPDREDIVGVVAGNPGLFALTGTNSWIVGREPAWLVDPGPALGPHVDALTAEIHRRGGLGGIALTHDHHDHAEAVPLLRERFPRAPVAAARGAVDQRLRDGDRFGPLQAIPTPGHSPDHVAYVTAGIVMTGVGAAVRRPSESQAASTLRIERRMRPWRSTSSTLTRI